jgi:hypothetical protein
VFNATYLSLGHGFALVILSSFMPVVAAIYLAVRLNGRRRPPGL